MMKSPEKSRKDYDNDADATNSARDKFKGELKKLYESDNSTDSDDYQSRRDDPKRPRERPARRPKARVSQYKDPPPPSFVMKLFDRSVDLTQFQPDTPLYPICRAWFRNNPRIWNSRADSKKDWVKKKEDRKFSEKDCYILPTPLPMDEDFVPSPPPPPMVSEEFSLEYDAEIPLPCKEELLDSHIQHWTAVRKRIKSGMQKRERRYAGSLKVIRGMYYDNFN